MTFHLFHSNDPGFLLSYSLWWKECRSPPSPITAPQLEVSWYNKRQRDVREAVLSPLGLLGLPGNLSSELFCPLRL